MKSIITSAKFTKFNSFPNDHKVDWSKAFTDNNLNVSKVMKFVFDKVENIVGKGKNADVLFPQYFQKAKTSGLLIVWVVQ